MNAITTCTVDGTRVVTRVTAVVAEVVVVALRFI